MKNVLIAFDKFKDALTALEACNIARDALEQVRPDWSCSVAPLADGGDGFCQTLTALVGGAFESTLVRGPDGTATQAEFGLVKVENLPKSAADLLALPPTAKSLGIIEMAQTSGIALVPSDKRSPWDVSSYGLGQCMRQAVEQGADALLVGLGGSATHDLGLGALQALGYEFFTRHGRRIETPPVPSLWDELGAIEPPETPLAVQIRIACDVENPLLGPTGAAAVFGPQKGLAAGDVDKLDSATARVAIILSHACGVGIQTMDTPGAGAAGGAGFGLTSGLDGTLIPGAELVFAWSGLRQKLEKADLVITGEGRFDASSLQGKGPGTLVRLALSEGKQARVFAGSLGPLDDPALARVAVAISPPGLALDQAIAATRSNLKARILEAFAIPKAPAPSIFHETKRRK